MRRGGLTVYGVLCAMRPSRRAATASAITAPAEQLGFAALRGVICLRVLCDETCRRAPITGPATRSLGRGRLTVHGLLCTIPPIGRCYGPSGPRNGWGSRGSARFLTKGAKEDHAAKGREAPPLGRCRQRRCGGGTATGARPFAVLRDFACLRALREETCRLVPIAGPATWSVGRRRVTLHGFFDHIRADRRALSPFGSEREG
jgi:hypothetical protein